MNSNMTNDPSAYFNIPGAGLVSSDNANTTDELIKISGAKKNNSVINSSVMFTMGFLSNILALAVLKRSDAEQRRKLFYRLVAGLAFNDLFGTCATSPVVIAVYSNDFKWIGGTPMCKYFGFMMIFAGVATMTIVCLMSVERLVCIRHPYFYYSRLRPKHAIIFLCGAWIFAAVVASLPIMGFGEIILQYPYTWCFFDYYSSKSSNRGFNYFFAILALFTISVTVTCNAIVLYTLFRTKMRGFTRKSGGNSRTFSGYSRRYAECQMAVLLIGITIVFSSCYLPLMIRIFLNQTKLLPVNLRLDLVMIRLASLNQILDPWVYILLRREVIWSIVSAVKSIYSKKPQQEPVFDIARQTKHDDPNRTCCVFCWHCMCDPPQQRRPNSFMSSFYYGANTPPRRHSSAVTEGYLSSSPSTPGAPSMDIYRPRFSRDIRVNVSFDLDNPVTRQPRRSCDARVDIYTKSSSRGSDHELHVSLIKPPQESL